MNTKVIIKYDGSAYNGWQNQSGQNDTITIEEVVEAAISKINRQPSKIIASGRTDSGVHALAQVFNFENAGFIPTSRLAYALNNLFPSDIEVVSVEEVADDFHARFSAKSKEYHYYLNNGQYDLFKNKYQGHFKKPLDLNLMEQAISLLLGRHDFRNFNATPLSVKHNQTVTIESFTMEKVDDLIVFKIVGSSFLKYMVRMLVGSVVLVGAGELPLATIEDLLNNRTSNRSAYKIMANGLYLVKVNY